MGEVSAGKDDDIMIKGGRRKLEMMTIVDRYKEGIIKR